MNLFPLFFPLDFWDTIMQPIYWLISGIVVGCHWLFSQNLDPNKGYTWLLSIIALTVVVRSAMIPLYVKQINASRQMQLLQPKMQALQQKYGNDREKLGQEQMKLYQEEGINPMSSCLPILIQMPIFIGLFNVLNGVSHGYPVGKFFWDQPQLVNSLRDSKFLGAELAGTFMPMTPWGANQWMAGGLIIGLTVTLFITQLHMMRKNMPPEALVGPAAQSQKMMLYVFPLMYLFTGITVPIGVMVYWMASNLWTLVQQYILIRNSPTPGTPAFIDWEERMRAKGKDPVEIMRERNNKRKKTPAAQPADPTKVTRQSNVNAKDVAAPKQGENKPARQTIQRQQPQRGNRASRKQ